MELKEAIQHLQESLTDPTHKWGCEECKAEHEQLLEWLEDYKRLKDEMIPAYDEQLTEAQCKVVQQMREMKQLKADYIDLDNRLRTANTEIDRLQTVNSWIPCSERLPEDNVNVLGNITITVNTNIAKPKQRTIFAKHDRVFGWTTANGYPIVGKITHWMPLPNPPEGGTK